MNKKTDETWKTQLKEKQTKVYSDSEHIRHADLVARKVPFTDVKAVTGILVCGPTAFFIRDKNDRFHFVGIRDTRPAESVGKNTAWFMDQVRRNATKMPYLGAIDALGVIEISHEDGRSFTKLVEDEALWKYIHGTLDKFHLRVQPTSVTCTEKIEIKEKDDIKVVRTLFKVNVGDMIRIKTDGAPLQGKSEKGNPFVKKLTFDEMRKMFESGSGVIDAGKIQYEYQKTECDEVIELAPHKQWNFLVP